MKKMMMKEKKRAAHFHQSIQEAQLALNRRKLETIKATWGGT